MSIINFVVLEDGTQVRVVRPPEIPEDKKSLVGQYDGQKAKCGKCGHDCVVYILRNEFNSGFVACHGCFKEKNKGG